MLILFMAANCRLHGIGGWDGFKLFARLSFISVVLYCSYLLYAFWAIPLAIIAFFGFVTGHGRFYEMLGANLADPNLEWIEKRIVQRFYKGDITKPIYSWLCMGTKGLMIGLPIFPIGLTLSLLWPAAYVVSFKYFRTSAIAEYLTGYFVGVVLCLSTLIH